MSRHGALVRAFSIFAAMLAAPCAWGQTALDCSTQLIGSSQSGELYTVNLTTGAGSLIGTMPSGLATEVEYDITNGILYADETDGGPNLHTIDLATGASTGTAMHPSGALNGLEFANGNLYGTFISGPGGPSEFVIVDPGTANFTDVGPTGYGPISGLAYDENTGVMYGVTAGGSTAQLVTISLTTGAATAVGSTNYEFIGGLEFGPDGVLYAGTANGTGGPVGAASATAKIILPNTLLTIDTATGAASVVGPVGFSVTGLSACAQPASGPGAIPALSPALLAVLAGLLAIFAVLGVRRRRA